MRSVKPHLEGDIHRDGVRLQYAVYGEGEQTLLFIPTWMFVHSHVYRAQIPYFSDSYRCITWDPRGNGKSDSPTDPALYGQGHYVEDALAIMAATDTDKAILFGYSQSGPTCAILASYYPELVTAVVTVGTHTPLVPRFEHNSEANYNSVVSNPQGWEKYNRGYWATNFPDFADFFSHELFVELHSSKHRQDVCEWSTGTSGAVLAASMAAPYAGQYPLDEDCYRRISCPQLIVHGRLDAIAPVAASIKVAALCGCDPVIFETAGHAPHARYPVKFNLLMRDFLREHAASPDHALSVRKGRA